MCVYSPCFATVQMLYIKIPQIYSAGYSPGSLQIEQAVLIFEMLCVLKIFWKIQIEVTFTNTQEMEKSYLQWAVGWVTNNSQHTSARLCCKQTVQTFGFGQFQSQKISTQTSRTKADGYSHLFTDLVLHCSYTCWDVLSESTFQRFTGIRVN